MIPDLYRKDTRLYILQSLAQSPQKTSNFRMLVRVIRGAGLRLTDDQVTTEIIWLCEQGFAETEVFKDFQEFTVITATKRGVEVAEGLSRHPEISEPD